MSKKDYQALARAIHTARTDMDSYPACERTAGLEALSYATAYLAEACAQDSLRFDRARFIEACETGKTRGMKAVV